MNKKTILILIIFSLSLGVSARQGRDVTLITSYILPVENSAFNSSLVLGIGSDFWGIFEFTGKAYFEIDSSADSFFKSFQAPNVFSAGVGMNIPMGGFYLKSDYQRFFAIQSDMNDLSVSKFTDSYKFGIGIDLDRDVELEVYHRTLLDSRDNFIDNDSQGFIGVSLNFVL
ncbi:hypothetical protein EW093_04955 [Thiospirochaeta perfilievii]|uniref:Outer membrane protein beta-barrel domain-containing protein n=1 Tax=Thiospirochaeta perfilievii TaxID=252967 RepID=A0A5C1QBN5_9SPIO|nr:hypothetical protein [Thiospirochaeta perfilievii]QEN04074.1 hypothetical protein EW093_04955 [Thiospirochaeta perfilievii]